MGQASLTLLVNLDPGQSNAGLLRVAGGLSQRLGAAVIGIAARQNLILDMSGTCYVSPEVFDEERVAKEAEMSGAEAEFREAFHGCDLEWRSSVSFASPSDFIADQARHADLLLTSMALHETPDATRATAGELVMQCGRPVLVVPQTPATPSVDRVMLAWKDTREARRAAMDALPLMRGATHITVVEIAAGDDMANTGQRLADVASWLAVHGVIAATLALASLGDDAEQLESAARTLGANLIVAGAYGHSRIREWAFGGVTRTLLRRGDRCAMLSH